MARRREPDALPAPEDDAAECHVHLRRADGLDLEVSGSAQFVTVTLARLLGALGIVAPPTS